MAFVFQPVVRHIQYQGQAPVSRLAERAQYREAILITRAGNRPPPQHECDSCREVLAAGRALPFCFCVSGGYHVAFDGNSTLLVKNHDHQHKIAAATDDIQFLGEDAIGELQEHARGRAISSLS
ncbi:hypothetical protein BJX62DRAFT_232035 [Aspergillus germanicus]